VKFRPYTVVWRDRTLEGKIRTSEGGFHGMLW
jgi:hypothetical protein